MTNHKSNDLFQGHRVLPVKYDPSYPAVHHLFLKKHQVSDPCPEKPNLRTLMVSNVPSWMCVRGLRKVFQSFGDVDAIYLQDTPSSGPPPEQDDFDQSGFKVAYVVFERATGVRSALETPRKKPEIVNTEKNPVPIGLAKWRKQYNKSICLDIDALNLRLEEGVASIDAEKEEERRKAEMDHEEADEEGWVTVSRHTSRKPVGKISANAQKKIKLREAQKRKRKELENFYKHQIKKRKLERLSELREKFEADKKRQLAMKQQRKFKPA